MKVLEYKVTFTTPAFLGDAEQNGRWRTPPFKSLLRQWWRVAYAADHGFDVNVDNMRTEEGWLFGVASDRESASRKSQIRMRLDRWAEGTLKKNQWPADISVAHPEVKNREGNPAPVGSALYQGFGPLVYDNHRRTTTLKANAAIQAGESATLSLAVPEDQAPCIEYALWLIDRFGTLGGRSRNGWGSISLIPTDSTSALSGEVPLRPWLKAVDNNWDWPHVIGQDPRGALIWQTASHDDWKVLMKTLAFIKIGLRTQFVFPDVKPPHPRPLPRHWLSYPITRHTTKAFDRNARLPNQLRFKVRPMDDGKLVGVIFHVPYLPPRDFHPNPPVIVQTWQSVHALLDELAKPADARGYSSITDAARRSQLRPQLEAIEALNRAPE